MRAYALALVPSLFATGAAFADDGLSTYYACSNGSHVMAAYINTSGGQSYAAVVHDGRIIPMKAGPTGSGVRYVSLDASHVIWHVKGDQGFLARDDAGETMIADACTATN